MDIKKILGSVLSLMGIIGLIFGVIGIFESGQTFGMSPWPLAILGAIFFFAGIGLLRSTGGGDADV